MAKDNKILIRVHTEKFNWGEKKTFIWKNYNGKQELPFKMICSFAILAYCRVVVVVY